MMVSPNHPLATVVREANILQAERRAGAETAGIMAWLMKFGAVMIPTVGLFIRSKAFLEALMSTQEASPAGSRNGLVELGFSEFDAERFESELGDNVLVYIACPEKAGTSKAIELLRLTGAYETATLEQALQQELAQEIAA
jgi:hypothetical protein